MSVPASKRERGELAVFTKSSELTAYTVKICTNENNFPKRYRWCITNKIVDSAVDMNRFLHAANAIKVDFEEDFKMRQAYQKKALAETYSLEATMKVAHTVFGVDAARREYWARLVYHVRYLIRAWIISDKERYEKHLGKQL